LIPPSSMLLPVDLSPLWISLRAALCATIIAFFIGIGIARWMLTYRGQGRSVVDGVFTLPLVLPPTVVGFLLLLLLGKNSPLGQLLRYLDLNIIFTWPATVLAATIVAFPLVYKTTLGAFEQIDQDVLACARTLGASEWRIFWQILLPLAYPGVVAGTILAFARALGEFGATLMVAGSIPGETQTIPIAIFFAAESGRMGEALAWVLLMVGISLAVITWIHQGSTPQGDRPVPTSINPLTQSVLQLLMWKPMWKPWRHLKTDRFPAAESSREEVRSRSASLVVNLHKQLSGFHLESAFFAEAGAFGILGGSGSGKSMTLRCIAGLETPTQGQIILNQRVLFDSQRRINVPCRHRRIGIVFQHYALFPHMTVLQNVAFGIQDLSEEERSLRIQSYLELMQLQGLEHRYPHQLSGGQQQRVALARALAIAPDALLLDEPLSALDTYLRYQIEKLLAEVLVNYPGVTLFVTHDLEEVYRVCHHLMVMEGGRAIAVGSKYEVFEHPATARVAQITGCKNFSRAVVRGANLLEALDWHCILETLEPVPQDLAQVGVRAHQIQFLDVPWVAMDDDTTPANTFPCWVAGTSETPHRMTLYLKLHRPPSGPHDYHLQAEVFKEKWEVLKRKSLPWHMQIHPLRLMMLKG
jgi:molybdate transport system permease protein